MMKSKNHTASTKATALSGSLRKTSRAAGILYLITFVSVPTLALYGPVHQIDYHTGPGPDTEVITGGLLEIIVALSCIATSVVLYPVFKQQHKVFALGLVASRILEAGTIFTGVAFLLTAVSLQTGTDANIQSTSHALVMMYDKIFLLGQGFMPAVNDLLLGYMLYQSRLVPRALAVIGIAGALPLVAGYLAILFGAIGQHSSLAGLSALPVAVFEFGLGIYLIINGFRKSSAKS